MYGLCVVLHRRAAGRGRARADDARRPRPRRCASSSARRSPTRRATSRSSTASTRRSASSRPTTSRTASTETSAHLNPEFDVLFDEMLKGERRPAGARARGPRDARRGHDDLPHGHRGDAGAHRPALHHRLQRAAWGRCRASSRASRTSPATSTATSPSARASCATWRAATRATREAIQRTLVEVAPAADGVLQAPVDRGGRATTTS